MKSYFEAYRERMQHNDKNLRELGLELKSKGYRVLISKNKELISAITVYDSNGNGVRVQFNETPYRFTFEYDIEPSAGSGSGYSGKEFYPASALCLPLGASEVIAGLKPMYVDKRFSWMKVEL